MDECTVCSEQVLISKTTKIDHSLVCHECVRHMFEDAIENEDNYPVRWGSMLLNSDMDEVHGVLPDTVRRAFRKKEDEYQTPPAERLYCTAPTGPAQTPCGAFVTRLRDTGNQTACLCFSCEKMACLGCGEHLPTFHHGLIHQCRAMREEEQRAFEGLTKGKDYQVCPSDMCRRKVELTDGCNHMHCRCGQHFCFVCGEATIGYDHWGRHRRCPMYNHPDAPNAFYQPPAPARGRRMMLAERLPANQAGIRRNAIALPRGQGLAIPDHGVNRENFVDALRRIYRENGLLGEQHAAQNDAQFLQQIVDGRYRVPVANPPAFPPPPAEFFQPGPPMPPPPPPAFRQLPQMPPPEAFMPNEHHQQAFDAAGTRADHEEDDQPRMMRRGRGPRREGHEQ